MAMIGNNAAAILRAGHYKLTANFISVNGQLWMWGNSSHVIPIDPSLKDDNGERPKTSKQGHCKIFAPHRVKAGVALTTNHRPILKIACGAWHAAAITGMPGITIEQLKVVNFHFLQLTR
jgi:hypothetical protein